MNREVHVGVIRRDECYTLREFRARVRIGQYAWRRLRQGGFRVREVGKKLFVLGSDWIAHLEGLQDHAKESKAAKAESRKATKGAETSG